MYTYVVSRCIAPMYRDTDVYICPHVVTQSNIDTSRIHMYHDVSRYIDTAVQRDTRYTDTPTHVSPPLRGGLHRPRVRGRWRLVWGNGATRSPHSHPSYVSSVPAAVVSRLRCPSPGAPVPPSHLLCRFRRFRPATRSPPPTGPGRCVSIACPARRARAAAS